MRWREVVGRLAPVHDHVCRGAESSLKATLGDVAEVQGRLARVVTINEGNRDIGFEFVGGEPCPTCGRPDRISINEGCANWKAWVRSVSTTGESA